MVLLPEERGMTLAELRQIAARQQHQIEAQQQLLVAKEQRLKFLKQQEARHHNLSEQHLETNCLITLRDKVEAQELKLRQLRAMRGQVDQQKTNNSNLSTELDSIRALFCEKEKELNLAVSKVEELTRQLDEIRKKSRKNCLIFSTSELENLRRELTYRTKLSEQQNNYIYQQREKISNRQQDIAILDKKINELNERLHRKRLINEQFASQIHLSSLPHNSNCSILNNNMLIKAETRVSEILEPEHTQDDLAANLHGHKCDFGEFSLTKNDPKYQTLPYNTKFTLKEKQLEDLLSSSSTTTTEDESSEVVSNDVKNNSRPFSNMCNFSPRPFTNAFVGNSGAAAKHLQTNTDDTPLASQDDEAATKESRCSEDTNENKEQMHAKPVISKSVDPSSASTKLSNKPEPHLGPVQMSNSGPRKAVVKPAVPPKPALSVKPMFVKRENNGGPAQPSNKQNPPEQDSVAMALSFLKNKSSEKEKNDFRYAGARDPSQDPLLPKSRILTYFSKTILQPEGGGEQNERNSSAESHKCKSALPIKPKPLTIRKHPGIEPPKLKAQSVTSSYRNKVAAESPSKASKSSALSVPETSDKVVDIVGQKWDNAATSASSETPSASADNQAREDKSEAQVVVSLGDSCQTSENAVVKSSEGNETASDDADDVSDQSDVDEVDRLSLQMLKKGNLKGEGSARALRRVSFDPLALLLDAALEGELELVKKIASEVVNPSAANDEGITALHNAICAGQFEVVKFLVEFGCDVNAPDSDGWTPLHCAASCNNLAMVKFLVERGACIFATTLSDQETAAEKCEEDGAGFDGCSEYLFSLQENLGVMNNGIVYAVYDYDVQNADELSFKNGDMLTVLRRTDDEENEWWWCRLHDEEGYVPRNLLGLYARVTCPHAEKST